MHILVKQGNILSQTADLLVVTAYAKGKDRADGGYLDESRAKFFRDVLNEEGFAGKKEEWTSIRPLGRLRAKRVGVIGLGKREEADLDAVRIAGARIVREARACKAQDIAVALPMTDPAAFLPERVIEALAEGMWLGAYRFHPYKKKEPKSEQTVEIKSVTVLTDNRALLPALEQGLREAKILCDATALARDLVNTPSQEMTPVRMAEVAKTVAEKNGRIEIKIFDAEEMEKLGMHAALAIGRGSAHAPVGVHLTYHPKAEPKKRIALVGKAVTFDSGGLSLKHAEGMSTMKIDMAGAADVIAVFQALPQIAPEAEVHGIFLAVENMPSGSACRPGDVVKALNGTTIEILNTDAEGRVTLADALSYASRLKPDALIDLATLTGACVVALGDDVAGLMGNNRTLIETLLGAAKETGEPLWELPLYRPYEKAVLSKVADVKNTAGKGAGTITAALFLERFVDKNLAWAHVDIAGPSYAEKETRPDLPFGGTGFGVRFLLRYLQGLSR